MIVAKLMSKKVTNYDTDKENIPHIKSSNQNKMAIRYDDVSTTTAATTSKRTTTTSRASTQTRTTTAPVTRRSWSTKKKKVQIQEVTEGEEGEEQEREFSRKQFLLSGQIKSEREGGNDVFHSTSFLKKRKKCDYLFYWSIVNKLCEKKVVSDDGQKIEQKVIKCFFGAKMILN